MQEFRFFLSAAGFTFLFMATQDGLEWGLYASVAAWITLACLQRIDENKKKAAAYFLCIDNKQKVLNYAVIIILPALNYFFIVRQNSSWQSPTIVILYLSTMACVLIARSGDSYVLFDESSIQTYRKQVAYEQIGSAAITDQWLIIDSGTDQELKIKRKLLNEEILGFLNNRINIQTQATH